MSDTHTAFSNRPFVAGSLTGLRAFRVTPEGYLTGVFVTGYHLTPGVNQAQCATPRAVQMANIMSAALRHAVGLGPKPQVSEDGKIVHELVGLACKCGFYAYFDGKNDHLWGDPYDNGPRVAAIVEGFGKCVVGDRGFRAEKLRLVALVRPEPPKGPGRLQRVVNKVAGWTIGSAHRPVVLLFLGCALIALPIAVLLAGVLKLVVSLVSGGLWWAAVNRLHRHGWRLRMEQRLRDAFGRSFIDVDWTRLLANYPGVPVYPTAKAAMAAHPLTPPAPEDRRPPEANLSSYFTTGGAL